MSIEVTPYRPVRATEAMSDAPRFGHTKEFAMLFSKDQADVEDYAKGLLFLGIFVLCLFVSWSVVLIILKCLGPKRVGFLSGHPFTATNRRPFYVRMTFVVASLLFMLFTILLITQGITNLQDTVNTASNSNHELQGLFEGANNIAASLRSVGESSQTVRDELNANLGNFCPANANLQQITGIDFDALATDAINLLNELGDFIKTDVSEMQLTLDTAISTSYQVDDVIDQINVNDWQSLLILIPYIMLPSLMLVGVIMAWSNVCSPVYIRILNWAILPLFCIVTVSAFVLCASISLVAVTNADFCVGGDQNTPDQTVMQIVDTGGFSKDEIIYRAAQFYISQCRTADPWDFIRDYQKQIESANANVDDLSLKLTFSVDQLSLACGKDFGPFQQLLSTMSNNLVTLYSNANVALELLSCDSIVPIYTNTVYGGTCTYSVTGVTWAFTSFLVIAFMGMVMIMFRSSYLDNSSPADGDQRSLHSSDVSDPNLAKLPIRESAPPVVLQNNYTYEEQYSDDDKFSDDEKPVHNEDYDSTLKRYRDDYR